MISEDTPAAPLGSFLGLRLFCQSLFFPLLVHRRLLIFHRLAQCFYKSLLQFLGREGYSGLQ